MKPDMMLGGLRAGAITLALALAAAGCASGPTASGKTVDPKTSSLVMADPASLGFDPAKLADITTALNADVASGKIPGAYLLVGRHGKVGFAHGFGVQGPGQTTPMSDETIFRVFSMTKPIVAVQEIIPPEPVPEPILVRQLMSHTSGLIYSFIQPNLPISKIWADGGEMRTDLPAKVWSEQVVAKLPLVAEPGTAWNYSHGLDVLGGVVEQVSGKSLADAVKERVTGPLGMTDTAFFQPKDKAPRFAQSKDTNAIISGESLYYDYTKVTPYMQGGGGISSTAEDYLRFVLMLAGNGAYKGVQILKPETLKLMLVDQTTADIRGRGIFFPGAGMGFGLAMSLVIDDTKQRPGNGTFSWNGIAGTEWWYDPKNDLFMVWMIQDRNLLGEYQKKNRTWIYDALKK